MAGPGRTTKFDAKAAKAILAAVGAADPRTVAAAAAGVCERTLRNWVAKGKREKAGEFATFYAALKRAEAKAVAEYAAAIRRAATPRTETTTKVTEYPDGTTETVTTSRGVFEWTAAAWWLERRRPDLYGSDKRELAELRKLFRDQLADKDKADAGKRVTKGGQVPAAERDE